MGVRGTRTDLKLTEVWTLYIKSITLANYSPDTIERKKTHFRLLLKELPKNVLAKNVKQHQIDDFILYKQQHVKPQSLNSYLRVYRAFFNWAFRNGYIPNKLNFPMQKEQKAVPKSYTHKEMKKLLEKPDMKTCTFNEYRDWVIVNFIMATGARRTTIVGLNIEDVRLDDGYIEFNRTKNDNAQILPVSSALSVILLEYLSYRGGEPSDPLFCLDTGDRMLKDYLTKEIAKYNRRRGIERTSIHAIRHTFSRDAALDCHMDVFQLQKMLGHSDIKTTENYVRLFDKDVVNNVDNANPLNLYVKQKKKRIKMR